MTWLIYFFRCCKRKVSTTNRSITRSNKRLLISGNHYATAPDPRFINMTLGSGQPFSIVSKGNNVNKGFKEEPENKVSETNPPLHNRDAKAINATPIVKFDMPNYATEFDELNETLTTQEISYLITIDPPSLVELDVSHSEEEEMDGNQGDMDKHDTELHWEVTSYVNEPEKDPETQGTGNQYDLVCHDTQLDWEVTSYVNEPEKDPETQATINREDLVNHVTELHWEVTSYINEPEHAPEAQVIGEFEIVDVNYNET